ncbi:MAG TPA: PQQ-binding-like beta-propeller repeat protein [Pirellulaceae bacterium]|jgi:outer membrane protein assembly factor BamB
MRLRCIGFGLGGCVLRSITRLLVCTLLLLSAVATAGDWPQILGPNRNGHAEDERLAESWPAAGPKILWRYKLGSGYAGSAVAGDRVIVFHRISNNECVECLSAASGKSLWKTDFPATYRGGIDPDTGPRCVPLIAGTSVFVFGAAGDLHSVQLDTGDKLWSRSLYADYKGDEGYFGAGSTPILVSGQLLVNVGGRGAGIVALDPSNGKTLWQASDEAASYSSPTAAHIGGHDKAIFITRLNCVVADPATGTVTKLFPFGQRGPTVNAATPLVIGNKLFVTASYGIGAALAPLTDQPVKPIWTNDNTLSSQYATPIEHNGYLYGIHGREDQGVAELRCIEAATGKVQWKKTGFGVAHIIFADNKLLIQKADGHLLLAAADPTKYRELATARVSSEPTRALPALSGGRLFLRSGSGGGELICLAVGVE